MEGLINEIKILYEYYNDGNYIFFSIFVFSLIYIFLKEKNTVIKYFFVGYTVIILLVVWNPFCIYIFNKFINFSSMYRLYFMLPNIITIAYAFTKFVEQENNKRKFLAVFLICCFIVSFGNCVCNEYNMIEVSNYYKLPNSDVQVAKIIANDKDTNYKKALVPYGMSSKIRQVVPEIELAYTRIVYNPVDENGNPSPCDSDDASNYEPVKKLDEGDIDYVVNYCKENKINYLVLNRSSKLVENIEERGFYLYDKTDEHYIYKINNIE